ncbi:MAG: hypothetical protein AB1651_19615, partial [Pseudomonadota bacterium]
MAAPHKDPHTGMFFYLRQVIAVALRHSSAADRAGISGPRRPAILLKLDGAILIKRSSTSRSSKLPAARSPASISVLREPWWIAIL